MSDSHGTDDNWHSVSEMADLSLSEDFRRELLQKVDDHGVDAVTFNSQTGQVRIDSESSEVESRHGTPPNKEDMAPASEIDQHNISNEFRDSILSKVEEHGEEAVSFDPETNFTHIDAEKDEPKHKQKNAPDKEEMEPASRVDEFDISADFREDILSKVEEHGEEAVSFDPETNFTHIDTGKKRLEATWEEYLDDN